MSGAEWLRPIPPESVPGSIREAALAAYAFGVRDLGLRSRPVLVWATAEDSYPGWDRRHDPELGYSVVARRSFGVFQRRGEPRIVVVAERHSTPAEVEDTVLHELCHTKQHEQGWPSAKDDAGVAYFGRPSEVEARAYARAAARRLAPTTGHVPEWREAGSSVVSAAEAWFAALARVAAREAS